MNSLVRFALHGGAGDPAPGADSLEYRAALRTIAQEAVQRLLEGASAIEAVELAVIRLEDCPLFNAGVGAVLNRDGQVELDAAIMDGRGRACGAVAGISRVKNPVRLARAIMQKSPHVLFMGAGAEALAREFGLPEVSPEHFFTEQRLQQLKRARQTGAISLDHDSPGEAPGVSGGFGTVGAVARDEQGHLAAATSTGGLTNKHAGRIGDTPVIGAGTFADNDSAAVSCTGTGEAFIKAGFGHHVHARLKLSHWTLAHACEEGLMLVKRHGGRGGCIAVDRDGALSMPFNSKAMYRAWAGEDGRVRVAIGEDEGE